MGQQFLQNPGVDDALIRVPNALSTQVVLNVSLAFHEAGQVPPVGPFPEHFFELCLGHATGELNALARCRDLLVVQLCQGCVSHHVFGPTMRGSTFSSPEFHRNYLMGELIFRATQPLVDVSRS